MFRKIIFLLLIFALCLPAFAQKQTPPEGGTPKDFVLPAKQTFTLDNGLGATLVQWGSLPKVTVQVVVRSGNLNESENEVWLADLTGDMMKEGTATRTAQQIAEEAAGMGGALNVNVSVDQSTIGGDVLSEFGPNLVALIGDIARNPVFPESEVARLKNDMLRQLSIQKSQPGQIAFEKFRQVLYQNHPYGRVFPTEEMIDSYTVDNVKNFFKANFGAARTHVYVVGQFDAAKMEKAIRDAFNGWERGADAMMMPPSPTSSRMVHLIDRPGAPQSTLNIGLPVIDPSNQDYMAMVVTNALLGGSFGSRITSNIRENKGYTYSPNSSVSVRYRDSYWLQVADVTTSVTGPSLKEIFYEIDRLQAEPPSADELRGIQNYLAGIFVLQNSSPGGIIGQLSFLRLHGLEDSFLTNYVKNIHAVTPEEVQRVAKTYLRDEEMTIVVVGDKKQISSQLSAYGQVVEK